MKKLAAFVEVLESRIAPASLPTFDAANLGDSLGFELITPAGISGFRQIGDLNDDGFKDLLLFSLGTNSNTGAAYILFGKESGFPASVNLSLLDGTNGFSIAGEASGDRFGRGTAAGDVNGDGFDDIIIGAPGANNGGTDRGSAYVIFGRSSFSATLALSSLDGSNGFKMTGEANGDYFGYAVGGNGDFNGDGFTDLIIGAPRRDSFTGDGGSAYIVYGKGTAYPAAFATSALDGTNGFTIGTSTEEYLGAFVGFIGDLDRDGRDEVAIGESLIQPSLSSDLQGYDLDFGTGEDETGYVVYGSATSPGTAINIATSTSLRKFQLIDDKYQYASFALPMKDYTGDGVLDFVTTGADARSTSTGINYGLIIVPGKANAPFVGNPLTQRGAKIIARFADIPSFGGFSTDSGDFNGDGFPDFLVDALGDDKAELYFGGKLSNYSLVGKARTDNGIAFTGLSSSPALSVGFAGDINGDGFQELIATTPAEGGGERAFIIFGSGLKVDLKGNSATYRDIDGDIVTIKSTKGTFDYTQFLTSSPGDPVPGGIRLDLLDLSNNPEFEGASITITVKKNPAAGQGDGLVAITRINASGIDLGNVKIEGTLGEIDAGNPDALTPGLKKLDVVNFTFLSAPGSEIVGPVGSINVKGTWNNALSVTGIGAGIKSISVRDNFDGVIQIAGVLGSFTAEDVGDGSVFSTGLQLAPDTVVKPTKFAVHELGAATVAINGGISTFKAAEIGAATITADRIASLIVSGDRRDALRGDFAATLTLDNGGEPASKVALGSMKVAGVVTSADVIVQGTVGSFSAGGMVDSTFYAGFTSTGGVPPISAGTFLPGAAIRSFAITGKVSGLTVAMDSSFVGATSLGSVRIKSIDSVNGGTAWGFVYQDKLASLKVSDPAFSYDTKAGGNQTKDNFMVIDAA